MKKRRQKEAFKKLVAEAPRIRCRYCSLKDNCKSRERKERMENDGVMTRCLLTPGPEKKKAPANKNKRQTPKRKDVQ